MGQSQTNIRGLWRENRQLEKIRDSLQRDLAQTQAAMAAQVDSLKRHIADLENVQSDTDSHRDHLKSILERLRDASSELVQFTSYAEVVGGISINRNPIREWCDTVFSLIREADAIIDLHTEHSNALPDNQVTSAPAIIFYPAGSLGEPLEV